jgi:hypothetical protein
MKPPVQLALFGPASVHLYRWDAAAVAVPSRGNPLGEKYRMGALKCAMCGALESFVTDWADCSSCPGFVEPVPPWVLLGGSGTPAGPLPLVAAKETPWAA